MFGHSTAGVEHLAGQRPLQFLLGHLRRCGRSQLLLGRIEAVLGWGARDSCYTMCGFQGTPALSPSAGFEGGTRHSFVVFFPAH